MPTYEYTARTAAGEQIAGVLQAENEQAAARALDERSLFPVRVAEQAGEGIRRRARKVRGRELGVLYGQLADLLRAGVPLLRALQTAGRAATNRRLAEVVRAVGDDISSGKTLAEAMAVHPQVFSPLHSAMVRAGEEAGFLEDVLANLSDFLERQDELRSKVRGAMIYPAVLLTVGVLVVIGVLIGVVPKFRQFFRPPLPAPTAILFVLSDLLTTQLPLLLGLVVLGVLGVRSLLRSESGRRLWEQWRLKLPVVGRTNRMLAITRFCRILGTMLRNGVPILQALAISKDATGSDVLAGHIDRSIENVRAGEPLADPLRTSGLFPAEILEMIAVAEESNQLDKVLVEIANTVERRTNRQVDAAVRVLEPLILVVMAVLVGFIALGLVYPIFTMASALE